MDYNKHYNLLIAKYGSSRKPSYYAERHHITPRCVGGTNAADNLVYLSAEAHFVAHLLLVKIYRSSRGVVLAARYMTMSSSTHKRNNKMYSWLRKEHKKSCSAAMSGKNNPQYGKPVSDKMKAIISKVHTGNKYSSKKRSEEYKIAKSIAYSGSNNPFFGKRHSEETKAVLSKKHKDGGYWVGRKHSKETLNKMSIARAAYWARRKETQAAAACLLAPHSPSAAAAGRLGE